MGSHRKPTSACENNSLGFIVHYCLLLFINANERYHITDALSACKKLLFSNMNNIVTHIILVELKRKLLTKTQYN